MTKYRETLRLSSLGFSNRNIALSVLCSRNTVAKILKREQELDISWPLDVEEISMEKMNNIFAQTDLFITIFTTIVTAVITFFIGRYTSRLDDRRQGLKDIDETFYKPFISLYLNAHHANAFFFVDLPLEAQDKIVELLLENRKRVPPWVERKISEIDLCYSGYSVQIKEKEENSAEDKEYIEKIFQTIFEYAEKQYGQNERKLYHNLFERVGYKISEWKNR